MDNWQEVACAPKNIELKVKHESAVETSSLVVATGILRDGKWFCSQAFIDPDTMLVYWEPTHWALLHRPPEW